MGSHGGQGGARDLEEQQPKGTVNEIANDTHSLFFVDTCGNSNGEEVGTDLSDTERLYDRCDTLALGDDEEIVAQEDLRNRCFNCGSPDHIVPSCEKTLNRPLIALSRAMFDFFKDGGRGGGEPERLHEYEARKAARLQFSQSFRPGVISNELLRDALGLNPDDDDDEKNEFSRLPWLWNMLEWGYPPGWFSENDPTSLVIARIEGEDIWMDEADASQIFDNPIQVEDGESTYCTPQDVINDTESTATLSDTGKRAERKRWAHYQTDLFSSEHLTLYSGKILSPVLASDGDDHADRIQQRKSVPPWRRPDAFSAFGPAGWQAVVNHQDRQLSSTHHRNVDSVLERNGNSLEAETEAEDSDMELSD